MMKILYHYYYLFYTKVIPDDEPHLTVVFSLGLMQGFVINGLLNIFSILLACYHISKWPLIGVGIATILTNYLIYYKSKKGEKIITEKPKLLNSNFVSVILGIVFFLFSLVMIIGEPFYSKYLLERFCH